MLFVVCAGSQDEARAWSRRHGIPSRQVCYASSPHKLLGLRDFAVVRLPGFFGRRDRREIEDVVRANEMKRRMSAAGCARGCGG